MDSFDISIIIPIYNVEKYIYRCIDSVVNQMDEKLEVILVDDGSPDNCPGICDSFASKFSNIKVIHKTNGGLSDAIKVGVTASSGRYIAFVDSDDWLENGWYSSIKTILSQYPSIDMIYYGFQRVENEIIKRGNFYSLFKEGYYTGNDIIPLKNSYMKRGGLGPTRWNKVYSRNIALKCLEYYDTRLSIGEDLAFSAIALDLMNSAYILKDCFVNYYINSESMTSQFNDKYESSFEILFETLQNYYGNKPIVYYVNYINIRTIVNYLGKSHYVNKKEYLKRVLKHNRSRIINVKDSDLGFFDKIVKRLMIAGNASALLWIAYFYRLSKRLKGIIYGSLLRYLHLVDNQFTNSKT